MTQQPDCAVIHATIHLASITAVPVPTPVTHTDPAKIPARGRCLGGSTRWSRPTSRHRPSHQPSWWTRPAAQATIPNLCPDPERPSWGLPDGG